MDFHLVFQRRTPLYQALYNRHFDVARWLLERGAKTGDIEIFIWKNDRVVLNLLREFCHNTNPPSSWRVAMGRVSKYKSTTRVACGSPAFKVSWQISCNVLLQMTYEVLGYVKNLTRFGDNRFFVLVDPEVPVDLHDAHVFGLIRD